MCHERFEIVATREYGSECICPSASLMGRVVLYPSLECPVHGVKLRRVSDE